MVRDEIERDVVSRPRRRPKLDSNVHVRDGIDFDCPFCDGKCTASEEHTMVVHSMPFCDEFQELEITDFLRAVNEKMEKNK